MFCLPNQIHYILFAYRVPLDRVITYHPSIQGSDVMMPCNVVMSLPQDLPRGWGFMCHVRTSVEDGILHMEMPHPWRERHFTFSPNTGPHAPWSGFCGGWDPSQKLKGHATSAAPHPWGESSSDWVETRGSHEPFWHSTWGTCPSCSAQVTPLPLKRCVGNCYGIQTRHNARHHN